MHSFPRKILILVTVSTEIGIDFLSRGEIFDGNRKPDDTDDANKSNDSISEEIDGEENGGVGSSLAFVFDSTGSMGDELTQVKIGATKILAALRDHPEAPVRNYVWVPFNDPEVGPVTITTDPKVFEERMSKVIASGGGDCPEMSVGAIKKALDISLPNSYIYVFTDAPAKDDELLEQVLSLIQRKQAQVVFIITQGCLDTQADNMAYERIAETSSGQIYKLTTDEVKEVLKYVKVALQPHVVSLLSLNKPAPDKRNADRLEVIVDDSLRRLTVSVSGTNARIDVTDPNGIHVVGLPRLENVLNLANIKIVNVNEPDPGAWNVVVNSDSNYTIRSTGLSKINFVHGFSTKETYNIKETNYRPLKGAKSFILIQASETDQIFNITYLDFVNLTGDVIKRVDLIEVKERNGLYKAGSFVPPDEFFHLGVTGFGKDGRPIKRITSTAVSAQLPEKPIVTMKSKAIGKIGKTGTINCYVESAVPFALRWWKNERILLKEQNCSETCETILDMDRFTLQSEGRYSCEAINAAGRESKTLSLTVTGDAPSVKVKSTVVASPGDEILLDCHVESQLPFAVAWAQFTATNQNSGVMHPSSAGIKLENNSLLIKSVGPEDEGWFVCAARSKAGESQGRILLLIKEPLVVKTEPRFLTFAEGDSARLICSATGKPKPRMEWSKNHEPIKDPSVAIEEIGDNSNLVIDFLEKRHAGTYTCNAANFEESASSSVELTYTEVPKVKAKENNVMVKAGSRLVMKCTSTGVPKPTIKWFKQGKELLDGGRFQIAEGALTINETNLSDFGEYSCVARNDGGTAVDHIGLTIGNPPDFWQKIRSKEIRLNHAGTISCSAFGVPPPEIKWTRSDGRKIDPKRTFVLSTGALKISRVVYEDEGEYVCTAENVFGSVSQEVTLKVTGVVKPAVDGETYEREVKTVAGSDVTIPCGIALANPPAKVRWFKYGIEVQRSRQFVIESSGDLTIRNVTTENGGSYLCSAENVAGIASRSYDVFVSASPTIMATNREELKGKIGGEIVITCPADGFPNPTVTWTKNGLPLPTSSNIFQDESGSLIIKRLTEDNAGNYVCTATNAVGSASKETTIQVQVPPTFADDAVDFPVNVVEGHSVVLNCNATATPEPIVRWFKNDEPFVGDAEDSTILRFFATTNHTGIFKCIVTNEAGSDSREFNVTILVPPRILGRQKDESIKAKAGTSITITCNVTGVPSPIILWQRNGMYLTQNTSEVIISDDGSLTIKSVAKESAGSYVCDAENLGGITQRIHYLQVDYPPKIVVTENDTTLITLREGDEYSLACVAEGNPKPKVTWKKNGLPIHEHETDLKVLEDNTLAFLRVNNKTSGIYKCEAINAEGSDFLEYDISVASPPPNHHFHPTKLEVNEGDSLELTCPTAISSTPPSKIRWIKNGKPLDALFRERSDEVQVKLSPDERILTIMEAHPSYGGNYSCVATDSAVRTDARFSVDILMTPHFEEFNHVAHRTILTGGEVVLNCSVSGNPPPKVIWRKGNSSVDPRDMPGIRVTSDKRHLMIVDGKVDHTGTYVCLATNKVNTKEREFYVTVLEPPQIGGSLHETIRIRKGDDAMLECKSTGFPSPTYTWIRKDDGNLTNSKSVLNNTEDRLKIAKADCDDNGTYLCEVSNRAGTRIKYFKVEVFESLKTGNQKVECKTSGTLQKHH